MEPAAEPKPFISPIARTPPGSWKKMRAITPLDPSDATTLSTPDDYFITRDFSDYRMAFAKYLIDHRSFRCVTCSMPLQAKFNWCLCMRCLVMPYCGRICLQQGQALHSLGCQQSHVWSTAIPYRAPYVPEEPTTSSSSSSSSSSYSSSSSSSSSSSTGGGDQRGEQRANRAKRQRQPRDNSTKPCRFWTEKGSCTPKDPKVPCDFKHCNEARATYLQEQLSQLKK
jgi:hypothetical protein